MANKNSGQKFYERFDERESALYKFETYLGELLNTTKDLPEGFDIIEDYKNFVGKLTNLTYYNMKLLAIASAFNYIYKKDKNKVNEKNITEFITKYSKDLKTVDPIDIIRYIRLFENLKY